MRKLFRNFSSPFVRCYGDFDHGSIHDCIHIVHSSHGPIRLNFRRIANCFELLQRHSIHDQSFEEKASKSA